ncbi:MAG: UDP-N-acetylmuramoyl-L-alanine--D-glutamate ligase [Gemmatimonadota bacterium]
MKPLAGRGISILGLGASGMAAARLALAKGGEVYVSDRRVEPPVAARGGQLRELGAEVELGGHDLERIAGSDTVVVSPGIPPDAPVLRALGARGVRWISEPEFAFHFLSGELIAVTGTNGKTTTAALTAHLLRSSGVETGLGGNIGPAFGPPVSELALLAPAPAWFVVELSSFQLADIVDFRPTIGVVTNLAPDHLDRYPSVAAYYADKARIFSNATPESRWVLNRDDPGVETLAGSASGERFWFSLQRGEDAHAFLRDGELVLAWEGAETPLVHRDELPLLGRHNVANALAAALSARLAGGDSGSLARGLKSFQALPHRLEPVGSARGMRWVNDSKATNVAATVGALESLSGPLVLLLGGKDKGEDLTPLKAAIHPGVRAAILYGEARHRLAEALQEATEVRVVGGSFEAAVDLAVELARPEDVILLSPACSSFDMFQSYEARGSRFAALARGEG